MAPQRDYNAGAAAVLRMFETRMHELIAASDELITPTAAYLIAKEVIDAVDAEREKQKQERDR